MGYNWSSIVSSTYGDHWRNLRRIGVVEIFSSQCLNVVSSIRKHEVQNLIRKLSTNSRSKVVELKFMFNELTFNIIMTMVAGKRYYGDDVNNSDKEKAKEFREIMTDAFAYSGVANLEDYLPILNWIRVVSGYEKKCEELGYKTDVFLQDLIDGLRETKRNTMLIICFLCKSHSSNTKPTKSSRGS